MKTRVIIGGAILLLSAAQSGRAAIVYSYVAPQSTYQISVGQTVSIPVYLQETLTAGSSSLIQSEAGLFGGGFSFSEPASLNAGLVGGTTLSAIAGDAASFPGGAFTADPSDSSTLLAGDDQTSPGATSGPVPDATGRIELGVVSVTAGTAGTVTNFRIANYAYPSATDGYTDTFANFYNLDATSTSPTYAGASADPMTVEVSVVTPEPACAGVLGLLALFGTRRRPPCILA